MARLMTIDQLLNSTEAVGIHLEGATAETANFYIMVDPDGNNIGIGRDASARRRLEDNLWIDTDYENNSVSGYSTLVAENDAQRHPLRYQSDNFDGARLLNHITEHQSHGEAIDVVRARIHDEVPPTAEEIEQILVRIHIRTGRLIGNSLFTSQWDTPINTYSDTVAVLVADAARAHGIITKSTKYRPKKRLDDRRESAISNTRTDGSDPELNTHEEGEPKS